MSAYSQQLHQHVVRFVKNPQTLPVVHPIPRRVRLPGELDFPGNQHFPLLHLHTAQASKWKVPDTIMWILKLLLDAYILHILKTFCAIYAKKNAFP